MQRLSHVMSLAVVAMLSFAASTRAAEAPPTAVFVVDGSGSMWGNLGADKRPKLEIVREVLRNLLPNLRPDARVGLASFGHRRRGNCGDAEVIVPPDAASQQRLGVPIEKLNAMGKGPLVLALREAANAIAGATPASIVLINDDVDNCGQDVCAAVGEIVRTSPGLVVHTIGIGLDQAKVQQMSCVAQLTGGKIWDAQDAAGLASAVGQAVNLANLQSTTNPATTEPAEGARAESKPASGAPAGLYLSAGLGANGATLDSPVQWRISKADGELVRDAAAPTLAEKLPPGSYEVEARLGLATAHQTIEVAADAPTPVRVDLNAGVLKMLARPGKSAQPLPGSVFTVAKASSNAGSAPLWIGRELQPEIVLPAGDYRVTVEAGAARQEQDVKIAAATGTTLDAILATGRLELSATRGAASGQGDPVTDGVTYILYEDDPDAPQGRREVARSGAAAPDFTLPAGTYYVTARMPTAEVREQIAIGAGDVVKRALPLALAHLQLAATLDGAPVPGSMPLTFRVVRLDTEPREIVRTISQEPDLDLSAGRYRIEASLGATNVIAATEIALAAGQAQKIILKLEAGNVTLKRGGAAAAAGDTFWEVRDSKHRTVLRSSQPEPTVLLAPGRYVVSADTRERPLNTAIEVKAGERRTFDFSSPQ